MSDYKTLIGRVRDEYSCTDELHRDLADAVEAMAAEEGRGIRAVQGWMALDLHMALGHEIDNDAENQGERSWAEWWSKMCAEVRALVSSREADVTEALNAGAVGGARLRDAEVAVLREQLAAAEAVIESLREWERGERVDHTDHGLQCAGGPSWKSREARDVSFLLDSRGTEGKHQ